MLTGIACPDISKANARFLRMFQHLSMLPKLSHRRVIHAQHSTAIAAKGSTVIPAHLQDSVPLCHLDLRRVDETEDVWPPYKHSELLEEAGRLINDVVMKIHTKSFQVTKVPGTNVIGVRVQFPSSPFLLGVLAFPLSIAFRLGPRFLRRSSQ